MKVYVLAIILFAGLAVGTIANLYPVSDWQGVVLLAVLGAVLGNMAFELPVTGDVSLGFAVTFAAIVYAGPVAGAVVGALGALSLAQLREGRPILLMVGNGAQLALSAAAAGVAYISLGATPLQNSAVLGRGLNEAVLAPLVATACFFLVNVTLVTIGLALKTGAAFSDTLRALRLSSYGMSLFVLALLGYVLASVLSLGSWLGAALLVLPLAVARRTFLVYLELSQAYVATVRSLVAAIEAKDPYTRGHSERVAAYSRAIAEQSSMSRAEVDLLERAALLHDIGKIGVQIGTLTSPNRLTAEEFRVIRTHPVIGSDLLAGVEFLSDVVRVIRHHHERVDGAGYPDGLAGSQIPHLARVLAVADSYDAMTSDRAYRPAMTHQQAMDELARVAGSQLDSRYVEGLIEYLRESPNTGQDDFVTN